MKIEYMYNGEKQTDTVFDLVDYFMKLDEGELDFDQTIELFQYLVDTGLAWTMPGRIGRQAADMLEAGVITDGTERQAAA